MKHTDIQNLRDAGRINGNPHRVLAVPTHIVARYRDYCCAGFMTFIGLTMGVSVMLFAYGPAVFILFVGRWKRLHPARNHGTSG